MASRMLLEEEVVKTKDPVIRHQFLNFIEHQEKRKEDKKDGSDPNYLNSLPAMAIIALTIVLCLSFAVFIFAILRWIGNFAQVI
ncbi:MAG: hypothetical protein ACYSUK_06780 [Planctomycetota bacterium]|jgi:hypothetical protein